MRRTLCHRARLIWRREGVELSTVTARPHHRTNQMESKGVSSLDTPLGGLGLLAAGEDPPNPTQRKVGVSSQAICLPNNVAVPEERLGEPGHLPLQSSSSLKLPLGCGRLRMLRDPHSCDRFPGYLRFRIAHFRIKLQATGWGWVE